MKFSINVEITSEEIENLLEDLEVLLNPSTSVNDSVESLLNYFSGVQKQVKTMGEK
ncbi:MAG: hypothetical protein QXL94_00120 [Candidatus Parvarchaeum sp.]